MLPITVLHLAQKEQGQAMAMVLLIAVSLMTGQVLCRVMKMTRDSMAMIRMKL